MDPVSVVAGVAFTLAAQVAIVSIGQLAVAYLKWRDKNLY